MSKSWTSRSASRFLQASILSFVLNIGLTMLLHEVWHASEELAFAIALVVVYLVNFVALRYYVYGSKGAHARKQFIIYSGSAIGFRGTEYIAFLVFHSLLQFNYRAVVIGILIASFSLKYFWHRLVFENRSSSGKAVENIENIV